MQDCKASNMIFFKSLIYFKLFIGNTNPKEVIVHDSLADLMIPNLIFRFVLVEGNDVDDCVLVGPWPRGDNPEGLNLRTLFAHFFIRIKNLQIILLLFFFSIKVECGEFKNNSMSEVEKSRKRLLILQIFHQKNLGTKNRKKKT